MENHIKSNSVTYLGGTSCELLTACLLMCSLTVLLTWCAPTVTVQAFIFDGRNILEHERLRSIGFEVYAIGKPRTKDW